MRSHARFWAYATSFGAAWGIWELTLGTFLHALKLPFAGPVLASAAAALLVAQRQMIPVRGITLATGLVAAACKSISPDGTIFGPMIGIMSEAIVVEFAFAILSVRLASPFAGAFAALCPFAQKIGSQLLFYGGNIIDLYSELIHKLTQSTRLSHLTLNSAAIILVVILSVIGSFFGIIGWWLGRRSLIKLYASLKTSPDDYLTITKTISEPLSDPPLKKGSNVSNNSSESNRLFGKKFLILFFAISSLFVQFIPGLIYAVIALMIMIVALLVFDRRPLSKIWRPKFWGISILIALGSGLLLGKKDITIGMNAEPWLSSVGLTSGILMLVRAAWILSLTSWISIAFNKTVALKWSHFFGVGNLGKSLSSAFGIMGELRPHATALKQIRSGKFTENVVTFFAEAGAIAERSTRAQFINRMIVVGIIGNKNSGKTTAIKNLAQSLIALNIKCGGICQPSTSAEKNAYDLLDISSGERRSFAHRRSVGFGYQFDPSGWDWSSQRILEAFSHDKVIFVDELGRLESSGKGHLKALGQILNNSEQKNSHESKIVIVGLQRAFLAQIAAKLGGIDY